MGDKSKGEENQESATSTAIEVPKELIGKIGAKLRELKENAVTYPYIWASYTLVYGGLGLWFAYRWRALRAMEDKVRVIQAQLRKEYVEEEARKAGLIKNKKPENMDKNQNSE